MARQEGEYRVVRSSRGCARVHNDRRCCLGSPDSKTPFRQSIFFLIIIIILYIVVVMLLAITVVVLNNYHQNTTTLLLLCV